jgi:hypothetical protein
MVTICCFKELDTDFLLDSTVAFHVSNDAECTQRALRASPYNSQRSAPSVSVLVPFL